MSFDGDFCQALQPFFDQGLISEVLYELKSGKEATVYCCRAARALDDPASSDLRLAGLAAAKVYRPLESRGFRNDAVYHTGRMHLARAGRVQRAAASGSAFGRTVQYGTWIEQEWSAMHRLHEIGADVIAPIARAERAILMPFAGDEGGPAPRLSEIRLGPADAAAVVPRLLWNIELMLDAHIVHGDLSPFNILWFDRRPVIIDFPQSVDPRLNPAAETLLRRDVRNVCDWGQRAGVTIDAEAFASDLWSRFVLGEIG